MSDPAAFPANSSARLLPFGLAAFVFVAFYFSTNARMQHFDYTAQIAGAFRHGHLGLTSPPPSWLSEMIPLRDRFYSVFPLGAVLSILPVTFLPARVLAASLACGSAYFFFKLSALGNSTISRRILLSLFPIFGTWTWCNLGFGGSWQLALGYALLGQAAALYYSLGDRRPLLAGACFALAVGNRTELVLIAPIFLYFLTERDRAFHEQWLVSAKFLALPAVLLALTAIYNFARFHSPFDFGYARIPGILEEPWYRSGIFSLQAIPWNFYKMLLEGVTDISRFPFFMPHGFGCSLFLSCPFLFLLFREGGMRAVPCWIAIGMLTFLLLCHGNPGGWQFSYRYAIVLLPWMFLLILGNGPQHLGARELSLFLTSIAINAVATYQFLWTDQIQP